MYKRRSTYQSWQRSDADMSSVNNIMAKDEQERNLVCRWVRGETEERRGMLPRWWSFHPASSRTFPSELCSMRFCNTVEQARSR